MVKKDKVCACGSTKFKMNRVYMVECTVDGDGNDISTGNLKGLSELDSELCCKTCGLEFEVKQ